MSFDLNIDNNLIKANSFLGVRGYEKDGVAYLHIEDVARGLGFTEQKDCVEYVKWRRIEAYLDSLGFATCGENASPHDYYIPENIFYRLCMKAKNAVAEAFQAKVADEIIPSIRKTGSYSTHPVLPQTYIEALEALLASEKEKVAIQAEKEQAEFERDKAKRERAYISSRREATVMAKLGAMQKKVSALQERLGESENYLCARAIPWLSEFFVVTDRLINLVGMRLKKICEKNGLSCRSIPDTRYGQVNAYPIEAVKIYQKIVSTDESELSEHRKRQERTLFTVL